MKQRKTLFVLVVVALLALSACSSAAEPAVRAVTGSSQPQATAVPTVVTNSSVTANIAGIEATLEQIYAQVNPSVVAIEVTEKAGNSQPRFQFFNGPQDLPQAPAQQALGSGFVWDSEGHIVTNNHVVDGASRVLVIFSDGSIVKATVVGADPDSDLAVVKVDVPAGQLHPVQMADSTQAKVGQLAVAIGNPFGEQNTMTVGFVSALARSLPVENGATLSGSYTIPDIIQTDAPINPGNSGGVLVNNQGQVLGVTAAIESPVRASVGIGFAIPSTIVQKVVPELIKNGHFDHSWLGISGTTLTPDLATAMNLKNDQRGALVIDVTSDGPAEKAGVKGSTQETTINGNTAHIGGDVITAIDNQPVKTFDDLVAYLASSTEVNQQVTLTLLRDGQQQTVNVTLAARPKSLPSQQTSANNAPAAPQSGATAWLGIQGLPMSPEIASAMKLPSDQQGVLIVDVQSGSPAAKANLQGGKESFDLNGQSVQIGGDVITAIDQQPVTSMRQLQSAIRQAKPGQTVTLTILRDGQKTDVQVTLAALESQ